MIPSDMAAPPKDYGSKPGKAGKAGKPGPAPSDPPPTNTGTQGSPGTNPRPAPPPVRTTTAPPPTRTPATAQQPQPDATVINEPAAAPQPAGAGGPAEKPEDIAPPVVEAPRRRDRDDDAPQEQAVVVAQAETPAAAAVAPTDAGKSDENPVSQTLTAASNYAQAGINFASQTFTAVTSWIWRDEDEEEPKSVVAEDETTVTTNGTAPAIAANTTSGQEFSLSSPSIAFISPASAFSFTPGIAMPSIMNTVIGGETEEPTDIEGGIGQPGWMDIVTGLEGDVKGPDLPEYSLDLPDTGNNWQDWLNTESDVKGVELPETELDLSPGQSADPAYEQMLREMREAELNNPFKTDGSGAPVYVGSGSSGTTVDANGNNAQGGGLLGAHLNTISGRDAANPNPADGEGLGSDWQPGQPQRWGGQLDDTIVMRGNSDSPATEYVVVEGQTVTEEDELSEEEIEALKQRNKERLLEIQKDPENTYMGRSRIPAVRRDLAEYLAEDGYEVIDEIGYGMQKMVFSAERTTADGETEAIAVHVYVDTTKAPAATNLPDTRRPLNPNFDLPVSDTEIYITEGRKNEFGTPQNHHIIIEKVPLGIPDVTRAEALDAIEAIERTPVPGQPNKAYLFVDDSNLTDNGGPEAQFIRLRDPITGEEQIVLADRDAVTIVDNNPMVLEILKSTQEFRRQ